ncbi:hypothetical protein IFM89_023986 [Coptis chinensis]|uniref:Uncharacterized protein n=1 Tax=Coptis chinensis TaxID=261450 RepID=A0A835HP65_9MAGN|nr:hypothetical protein IFM89_023986 [Coptis chinensis]
MVLALLIESDLALTEDVVETIVDKTIKGGGGYVHGCRNEEPCLTKTLEDWRTSKLIASDCNSLNPWNKKQKSVKTCIFPLRNLCCSNSATLENGRILILKVGNGHHVYDVQLQQLRSLEINPKNCIVVAVQFNCGTGVYLVKS